MTAALNHALFRSRRSPWSADAALGCCTEWKDKHEGQNMPLQMPHVSVCDSHNELPQSEQLSRPTHVFGDLAACRPETQDSVGEIIALDGSGSRIGSIQF